jgi:hypothetical protein
MQLVKTSLRVAGAAVVTLVLSAIPAQAQMPSYPYGGYLPPGTGGFGLPFAPSPGLDGFGLPFAPCPGLGGFGGAPVIVGPGVTPHRLVSPAERFGIREGRRFEESGILPDHPLSPAERRGFYEGRMLDEGFGRIIRPYR